MVFETKYNTGDKVFYLNAGIAKVIEGEIIGIRVKHDIEGRENGITYFIKPSDTSQARYEFVREELVFTSLTEAATSLAKVFTTNN